MLTFYSSFYNKTYRGTNFCVSTFVLRHGWFREIPIDGLIVMTPFTANIVKKADLLTFSKGYRGRFLKSVMKTNFFEKI